MKRLVLLAGVIVLSAVLALPGFAEITPGRASVSPFIGGYVFDDDIPLRENNTVFGLRLGYDITERWGWEGAFDWVPTKPKSASGDINAYGARLDALYHFRSTEKLVPFFAAGVGATMIDYNKAVKENGNDFLFNYGGGVKYFLSDDWALRADLRHLLVFDGGRQDWEYTVGLTWLFGEKKSTRQTDVDSDGDGVPDSLDRCPDTLKGVSVGDNGCPRDSDRDGVPDNLDRCAGTTAGAKVDRNGCPIFSDSDSDTDGIPDSLDKCPGTPVSVRVDKNGCPLDSDGDGVLDYLDKCPDTLKGAKVDKDGCPVVAKVVEKAPEKVSIALQIEFDSGKAAIKPQYDEQIKKVADFMNSYPETTAVIEGHTDNVGKEASNIQLSSRRAESVKKYLVEKYGIAAGRLSAKGFGSSQPVADNATAEGRQQNRRIRAVIETMKK